MQSRLAALVVIVGALGCGAPPPRCPEPCALPPPAPAVAAAKVVRQEPGPSLPLPEVAPVEGKPPASSSARAWHYRPNMVGPLGETIQAIVGDGPLSKTMVGMLITVVAARNHCLY